MATKKKSTAVAEPKANEAKGNKSTISLETKSNKSPISADVKPKQTVAIPPKQTKPVTPSAEAGTVWIDFPKNGEKILGGHYAIRITSPQEGAVEISLNGGAWQTCRHAVGHWWFDWQPFEAGDYKLVARVSGSSKTSGKSSTVNCTVIGTTKN